jgi:hypothetical protein
MLTFLVAIIAFVVVMESKFMDDFTKAVVLSAFWIIQKVLIPLLPWLAGAGITVMFYYLNPLWGVFVGILLGLSALFCIYVRIHCYVRKVYQRRKFNRENDVPEPFKGLRVKPVQ